MTTAASTLAAFELLLQHRRVGLTTGCQLVPGDGLYTLLGQRAGHCIFGRSGHGLILGHREGGMRLPCNSTGPRLGIFQVDLKIRRSAAARHEHTPTPPARSPIVCPSHTSGCQECGQRRVARPSYRHF
jgi:hypothetical protein